MSQGPRVERPSIQDDYGVPTTLQGTLPWSWAEERLESALVYWMATTRPDGRPHAMPTWGAWVDGAFWTEGSEKTRRARNMAENRNVVVHIDRGRDVVIVEGVAQLHRAPPDELAQRLIAGFAKYIASHGYHATADHWAEGGLWSIRPTIAFGWSVFPDNVTRWRFAP